MQIKVAYRSGGQPVGSEHPAEREGFVLGTNRDLQAIRSALDSEILSLQLVSAASPRREFSERLARLGRERIAISAVLVNRRIEASKKVVVLSRWLTGNGVLGTASDAPGPS